MYIPVFESLPHALLSLASAQVKQKVPQGNWDDEIKRRVLGVEEAIGESR